MTGSGERMNGGVGLGDPLESTVEVHVGPELVILDLAGRTPEDAIEELGGLLVANEHVDGPYVAAAIQRERVMPMGLPRCPSALPFHTRDPNHVRRPAIAVGLP